jgi:hypothetical protein
MGAIDQLQAPVFAIRKLPQKLALGSLQNGVHRYDPGTLEVGEIPLMDRHPVLLDRDKPG